MNKTCSHVWIDPDEPPVNRAPYSPIVGEGRRQMKEGKTYVCRECGLLCQAPVSTEVKRSTFRATFGEGND